MHGRSYLRHVLQLALLVGLSVTIADCDSKPGPAAAFACQDGDGRAACVPVQKEGGAWIMVSINPDGTLNHEMDRGDRLALLNPGLQMTEPNWVRSGKSSYRPEFELTGKETVPVLMPDGTLALTRGQDDHLTLSGVHTIAQAANPVRPKSMVDAALSAVTDSRKSVDNDLNLNL